MGFFFEGTSKFTFRAYLYWQSEVIKTLAAFICVSAMYSTLMLFADLVSTFPPQSRSFVFLSALSFPSLLYNTDRALRLALQALVSEYGPFNLY